MKQAAYLWNEIFDDWMRSQQMIRSVVEPCLYHRWRGPHLILVLVYVDDLRILADVSSDADELHAAFCDKFPSKDVSPSSFLGTSVNHDIVAGTLKVSMIPYIDRLLDEYSMTDCHPVDTPAVPSSKLKKFEDDTAETEQFPYARLIGSLMWLARAARPDIMYAVNRCASFTSNPGPTHIITAKRILRYLKGTRLRELTFARSGLGVRVAAYSDADHAGEPTENDAAMRSITGMVVFLAVIGPIYCQSTLQSTVADSPRLPNLSQYPQLRMS